MEFCTLTRLLLMTTDPTPPPQQLALARRILDGIARGTDPDLRNFTTLLSNRWTLPLLFTLAEKNYRFLALQRQLQGVSQRVMNQSLRNLEQIGFVTRVVLDTRPPTAEYSLSPLGHSLLGPLVPMVLWADANREAMGESQESARPRRRSANRSAAAD